MGTTDDILNTMELYKEASKSRTTLIYTHDGTFKTRKNGKNVIKIGEELFRIEGKSLEEKLNQTNNGN